MAFIFGILANPGTSSPSSLATHDDKTTKWSALLRWIPGALGVWLSVSAVPQWPAEYHAERARRLLSDWRFLDSADIADQAAEFSRKGLRGDPNNPELFYNLGESQVALAIQAEDPSERRRLYEESIASYKSALQLAPRDVRYVLCLAWSLDAIEQFNEAEAVFALTLQLDPNSGKVHRSYAAHCRSRGELEKAEAEYVRALELGVGVPADSELKQVRTELAAKKSPSAVPADPAR
jgi:tetratricopeptide (TPR) repeat protein